VVEVQTKFLKAAKCKVVTPDAGMWKLQGMGIPMKFTLATPADIQKAPAPELLTLPTTVSRPPTPHTPVRTLTGTPSGAHLGGLATITRPTPMVTQPGSTTPITTAMSGLMLASPFCSTSPPQHPPGSAPTPFHLGSVTGHILCCP